MDRMIEWLERMDRMEGWTRGLPLSANQPAYLSIDPLTDLATIKPFRPEPFRAAPAYLPYQPTSHPTCRLPIYPTRCRLPLLIRCLPGRCLPLIPTEPTCRNGAGEGRSEGWIRIGSKEKRIRIGWSLPSREGFVALS